jgi:hypothetical protein
MCEQIEHGHGAVFHHVLCLPGLGLCLTSTWDQGHQSEAATIWSTDHGRYFDFGARGRMAECLATRRE